MAKQYLWAKGICLAGGKAWGEDRQYYRWATKDRKWTSVNHEQESPAFMRGEYVNEHKLLLSLAQSWRSPWQMRP